jgi:hypothetical protein
MDTRHCFLPLLLDSKTKSRCFGKPEHIYIPMKSKMQSRIHQQEASMKNVGRLLVVKTDTLASSQCSDDADDVDDVNDV